MLRGVIPAVILTALIHPGAAAHAEHEAVRRGCDAYAAAWRSNDKAAVLAVLTEDAVLLPAHARPAVVGKRAIERFWWPQSAPPSTVTTFTATIDEADALADVGWCRGTHTLAFTYAGESFSQRGTYLMLLKLQGGVWRISHRMWDDAVK
jgi:uncharacterized protein (TIGR02246 family)